MKTDGTKVCQRTKSAVVILILCSLSLVKIQAYINIIMKTLGPGPMAEEYQPPLQDLSLGFWAKTRGRDLGKKVRKRTLANLITRF